MDPSVIDNYAPINNTQFNHFTPSGEYIKLSMYVGNTPNEVNLIKDIETILTTNLAKTIDEFKEKRYEIDRLHSLASNLDYQIAAKFANEISEEMEFIGKRFMLAESAQFLQRIKQKIDCSNCEDYKNVFASFRQEAGVYARNDRNFAFTYYFYRQEMLRQASAGNNASNNNN